MTLTITRTAANICTEEEKMKQQWIARYGYSVGGTQHKFNWFWIRDEYTPNEKSNAERFADRDAAKHAVAAAVESARVLQPHLQWRTAVERVQDDAPEPPIYCAICNEASGGRGSSMYGSVHKHGPTDHEFTPKR